MYDDVFGFVVKNERKELKDKYLVPPFTVLDAKSGDWQKRKRWWRELGIKSEIGREVKVLPDSFGGELDKNGLDKYGRKPMSSTSIFDPMLCEIIYNWFCPSNGKIIDPFAGGSVRGIVANYLGFKYTGIDIREEQINCNKEQASKILKKNNQPNWICGDSNIILDDFFNSNENILTPNEENSFDLIFTCPPYADLEVYSDKEGDISNMSYDDFLIAYEKIIEKSCKLLKKNGFACFVVGDIRDKKGFYRDFVSATKKIFIKNGCGLYNEAILLQPLGTAMLRAGKIFNSGKKLTKVHENILIFKKIV